MALVKDSGENIIIEDVTFMWAKLGKPVSPFGTLQYEVTLHLDKKNPMIPHLEALGVNFKTDEKTGNVFFNAKRKAEKADGSKNTPPTVVDTERRALDASKVGNGSTGKVKLFSYRWEHKGRKGTSLVLMAVLVENLVLFRTTGYGVDIFAVEGADAPTQVVDSNDEF